MEKRPLLKVSSDRLKKPGIKPANPGLNGEICQKLTVAEPCYYGFLSKALASYGKHDISKIIFQY